MEEEARLVELLAQNLLLEGRGEEKVSFLTRELAKQGLTIRSIAEGPTSGPGPGSEEEDEEEEEEEGEYEEESVDEEQGEFEPEPELEPGGTA